MSAQITVGDLAFELGVSPVLIGETVSRLCGDAQWGPQRVVAAALFPNRLAVLHAAAADEIRALLTRSAA